MPEDIRIWKCLRCSHKWANRKLRKPVVCPKCKSPYWNRERQGKGKLAHGLLNPGGHEITLTVKPRGKEMFEVPSNEPKVRTAEEFNFGEE